ncbi:MAG: preprotein translocase subunit SecG [Lachnospiraceae bacterium]|nr:preprotein translocase subunit SecG [Lachnospiraceae bacterium]
MTAVIRTILTVIFTIDCVALIILILRQQGKDNGLGAIDGMTSADTYWSKNKGRSEEGRMILITRILSIVFIGLAVVLNTKII